MEAVPNFCKFEIDLLNALLAVYYMDSYYMNILINLCVSLMWAIKQGRYTAKRILGSSGGYSDALSKGPGISALSLLAV